MSRTLYVHLGPRKTGTSAIQAVLRSHDNSTIIYPKVGLWGDGSHHGLVFAFFGESRKPRQKIVAPGDIDRLLRKLVREANSSDRNILISSETLGEGRDFEAFIVQLLSSLSMTPGQVEILVGCREHFSRAASLYNHRLRGSNEQREPDEFLRKAARRLCYQRLLTQIRKTGFKLTVLNYHPSQEWVPRFLRHIGFAEHEMPNVEWKNVGFSAKALVAMLGVSQITRAPQLKKKYLKVLQERMPDARAQSSFIFGREAAIAADRWFGEDREFLRESFGIELRRPDIDSQPGRLALNDEDLVDIIGAADALGKEGARLVEYARRFVQ